MLSWGVCMGWCDMAKVSMVNMEAGLNCAALSVSKEPGMQLRGHLSRVD